MALSTGCSGCDASGVYATITQIIFGTKWYDECEGLIIEDNVRSVEVGKELKESFKVYAYYKDGAPRTVNSYLVWSKDAGLEGATLENGTLSWATPTAGTYTITVSVKDESTPGKPVEPGISTSAIIKVG